MNQSNLQPEASSTGSHVHINDATLVPVQAMTAQKNAAWFPTIKKTVRLAAFWQRVLAFTIDIVLLGLISNLLGLGDRLISHLSSISNITSLLGVISTLFVVWQFVLPLVYFAWPYSTGGQTPGKKLLGIKVVSIDGSPLDWRRGVWRSLGYIPSYLVFNLGFLWSLWDENKQAWHDKMAGTCVVRASSTGEVLGDSSDPESVRRQQVRWRIGLGIPTLLFLILTVSLFFVFIRRNLAEVRAMDPWPEADISPEDFAVVNLSQLGLQLKTTIDARDQETWADGSYEVGSVTTYWSGGTPRVAVWVLRYGNPDLSAMDFQTTLASTQNNCGLNKYAYSGKSGIIHCAAGNGYEKIFWSGIWIVHIWANGDTPNESLYLVDLTRDAVANRWKEIGAR